MDTNLTAVFDALNRARAILLLPSMYPTREEVAMLALLGRTLEHNQKTVTLLLPALLRDSFPETFRWPSRIQEELASAQEVTITLDTEHHPVHALRYEQEGRFLRISLHTDQPVPESGDFVIRARREERFESTVVIGAPSIDLILKRSKLESVLTNSTLINIDTDPANEGFGDLNVTTGGEPLRGTIRQLIDLFPSALPESEGSETEFLTSPLSLPGLHMFGRMLARLTEDATAQRGGADDRREDATAQRGGADDRREDATAQRGGADDRREDATAQRGGADDRREDATKSEGLWRRRESEATEDATARRYDKSVEDLSGEPRAKRAGEGGADDHREDAGVRRGTADDQREKQRVWTSALTENDFEQSALSYEQFAGILAQLPLREMFFPKPYAVLWSVGTTIQCAIVGNNKQFYARLGQRIAGIYGFEGYRFSFETGNMEDARMHLTELLS